MNAAEEFKSEFKKLCNGSISDWQVWNSLIGMMACSISNSCDKTHFSEREKEFKYHTKYVGSIEKASKFLALLVMAFEENPKQDFLGDMFMSLGLNSHWKAQFFTPYYICELMSKMTVPQKSRDFCSVSDPACGAGATLIAFANTYNGNYQTDVLFAGQDVDRIAGLMCYIQLSLLGCPGYVCIADTLANPLRHKGSPLLPIESEGQELWYTPMFFRDIWSLRKCAVSMMLEFAVN